MIPLFVGLSLVNLLCLGVTMALGYWTPPASRGLHILAGALATLVCCGVHCVVFTYFIATAKWLQHAIAVKGLNPALATPTRSFRNQAFPAALLAMASMFGAAVLGAAADNYAIRPAWHHLTAIVALAINAGVAMVEYCAIARNGRLIDKVLADVNNARSRSFDARASNDKHTLVAAPVAQRQRQRT